MNRYLAVLFLCVSVLAPTGTASGQRVHPGQEQTLAKFNPSYRLPDGVVVDADLVYANRGERELHLDVFRPAAASGRLPGVLFVQGSGYNGNNKVHFWRQAAHLAGMGFVTVCIEHRGLQPDGARWPAQLEDAQAALRWMYTHAGAYGIDGARMGVVGSSSGAHIGALLGLMDRGEGDPLPPVRAVVLENGLLDLVYFAEHRVWSGDYGMRIDPTRLLGATFEAEPERWLAASPITHASAGDPPVLILHGTADRTLPLEQARRLYDVLRRAGVPAEFVEIEDGGHEMMNAFAYHETLILMERFLTRILRPEP